MQRQLERRSLSITKSPELITPDTLALVLAYVHRHGPRRVADARFLLAADLRVLAAWIGLPNPRLRSLRQHPLLAAHVALLQAAGLLTKNGSPLTIHPAAIGWLYAAAESQFERLLAALDDDAWADALERLRLTDVLSIDYRAYLRQSLQRQLDEPPKCEPPYADWMSLQDNNWQLALSKQLPPGLCFDMLQLGDWTPLDRVLTMTPLTVATAGQRGYALDYVCSLLKEATLERLPATRRRQLKRWLRRGDVYRLETAHLLTTGRPEQLAELLNYKRLRPYITRQIGPRHALITERGTRALQRWLAKKDYPLATSLTTREGNHSAAPEPAYQWLGLRLLVALGDLIPLPYAPPHAHLEPLSAQLGPTEMSELEAICEKVVDRLRRAIGGRDAFFPADRCPSPALLEQIESAICEERSLDIRYQGLGEDEPRRRRIRPLRLEQRGQLFYLHAYCMLAQAERTFRLDRLQACHDV